MSYRRMADRPRWPLTPQALFAITRVRASVFARLRCVCECVRACVYGRYTHGKQCVKGVYSGYLTLRLQMLCDPDQGSATAAGRIGFSSCLLRASRESVFERRTSLHCARGRREQAVARLRGD